MTDTRGAGARDDFDDVWQVVLLGSYKLSKICKIYLEVLISLSTERPLGTYRSCNLAPVVQKARLGSLVTKSFDHLFWPSLVSLFVELHQVTIRTIKRTKYNNAQSHNMTSLV